MSTHVKWKKIQLHKRNKIKCLIFSGGSRGYVLRAGRHFSTSGFTSGSILTLDPMRIRAKRCSSAWIDTALCIILLVPADVHTQVLLIIFLRKELSVWKFCKLVTHHELIRILLWTGSAAKLTGASDASCKVLQFKVIEILDWLFGSKGQVPLVYTSKLL